MTESKSLKFIATPEEGEVSALLQRPANAWAHLVLAHSAGAGMRSRFLEALATALAERGVATFRYNFAYKEKGKGGPFKQDVLTATVRSAVVAAANAAPDLPLFAGGHSMGGRMSSLAASQEPLPKLRGIIFFGFPLHPVGKPGTSRADHLSQVGVPMLFVQGPRDALSEPELLNPIIEKLSKRASLHSVAGADHSFNVLKSSGRIPADVIAEIADAAANWIRKQL